MCRKTVRNEINNGQIMQCFMSYNRVCKNLLTSNKYLRIHGEGAVSKE